MDEALKAYTSFWGELESPKDGLWIHPRDRQNQEFAQMWSGCKPPKDWQDYACGPAFAAGESSSDIVPHIVPHVHIGNLSKAKLVICGLNPGFEHSEVFARSACPEYRSDVIKSLHQDGGARFFYLEKKYAWTGGYGWWLEKWKKLWNALGIDDDENRKWLVANVASVELFPYHSRVFAFKDFLDDHNDPQTGALTETRRLPSVAAAQALFTDYLLPRAKDGKIALVVMRKSDTWPLDEETRAGVMESPYRTSNVFVRPKNHARHSYPLLEWVNPDGRLFKFLAGQMVADKLKVEHFNGA